MPKPYPSIRIFENEWMEKTTHVHPIVPLCLWGPVVLLLYYRSFAVLGLPVASVAAMSAAAIVSWTLIEYMMHRWVFHFRPEGKVQERIQYFIHGLHHADPQDPTRLVMPPLPALGLAAIFWSLFRALLGPIWVEPFFAAFLAAYLAYDYTHYATHHFTPRTRFGRWVKHNHMQHHYVNDAARWGVSSPVWDHVFGTLEPRTVEGSFGRPNRGAARSPST